MRVVSCLGTRTVRSGPFDPESSALTIRPPRLPYKFPLNGRLFALSLFKILLQNHNLDDSTLWVCLRKISPSIALD